MSLDIVLAVPGWAGRLIWAGVAYPSLVECELVQAGGGDACYAAAGP